MGKKKKPSTQPSVEKSLVAKKVPDSKIDSIPLARTRAIDASFPVVGIGASAGGLEALDELLDHMPPDTGMCFVIVTHQHPGRTSLLPELLGKHTRMPVAEATDGVRLQPNHVYVAPPSLNLAIL